MNAYTIKLCVFTQLALFALSYSGNNNANPASSASKVNVMVNGLPGLMALETAKVCIDRGYNLIQTGFTGPSGKIDSMHIQGQEVKLVKGPGIDGNNADTILHDIKSKYPDLIIVDYTHPSATLNNVICYSKHQCDFVMGTTGGEPIKIEEEFNKCNGNILGVIAPNMAKQIVAVQSGILEMCKRFPNSFKSYRLTVTESHQSAKADTSGTAKAIVQQLAVLTGDKFSIDDIQKIRDKKEQLVFGVPNDSLDGHAFHTYTLTNSDDTVVFQLKHNVCGRRIYAEGTADAVEFISRRRNDYKSNNSDYKRIFNMIDVLESGGMT